MQVFCKGLLAVLFTVLFCGNAFGQTGTSTDLGDLSSTDWKDAPAVISTLDQEQVKIAQTLSVPTLQKDEKALFMAYQRMLTYVQANMQAGKQMHESIAAAYDQVLAEAPKDPDLAFMPDGALIAFVPGLVEVLTEPFVPGN